MSHYDALYPALFAGLTIFFVLCVYGAYRKGCQDTWREADALTQTEPLNQRPINWDMLPLTTNCQECQDEQEQTL